MGQKAIKQRRALAQAKKKGKQSAPVTTDDEASTLPVNHAVTQDALSEMAIESDEEVAVAMHSLKAKVFATSHLGAAVEDGGAWCNI
jgi:hypothetical protein